MRELFGKRYAARSHRPHLACRHVGLPQIVARLGVPDRSLVANSQFVAAFRAAPCENCPAILARHAGTETMSLRPFAVIGLKCTFWHLGSITTGRRAPVARPCTIMDSAFSIHELDVGQDGNPMPLSFLHRCRLDSDLGGTGFSRCDERDSPGFFAQAEACTTTKSSFLCAPRRIVGQAILPAAGFRAGSALHVQSRPAGWRAGCSQDWLPHLAARPHCATRTQVRRPVPHNGYYVSCRGISQNPAGRSDPWKTSSSKPSSPMAGSHPKCWCGAGAWRSGNRTEASTGPPQRPTSSARHSCRRISAGVRNAVRSTPQASWPLLALRWFVRIANRSSRRNFAKACRQRGR
jgi:hypothetical protein